MRISGLDENNDWRFGRGRAAYVTRSAAIRQKVLTRLRSFANDWFLDMNAGGAWLEIQGGYENNDRILREIERIVLSTTGVKSITTLRIVRVDAQRTARVELTFKDIYDQTFTEELTPP